MKKLLFALAIMPLFIVACSSSDDIPSNSDFGYPLDLLYGEWRATSVESIGAQDLTTPINELYAAPTYLKFNKDGTLEGEGLFGEGTGKYSTKEKAIHTSIGKNKKSFEVISLNEKHAKVRLDAKGLGTALIPENAGIVTVTLTKDYPRTIDFDYKINDLYGKWHAISINAEGFEKPVDLTHPLVTPTYLTFEEKGVLVSEGYMGVGTGRYTTEGVKIYTLLDKNRLDFDVTELKAGTAKIEFDPTGIDFRGLIPASTKRVTLELKK